MKYQYPHLGIPNSERRKGEEYVPQFKMWVSGYEDSEFRIEWMRFEKDADFHPLIKTVPHLAFKVDDIEEAGAPIEFIQTDLIEAEIITSAQAIRS